MAGKNSTIAKLPEEVEDFQETKDSSIAKSNKELMAFIKKGGKSARPKETNKIEEKSFCLRVSVDIADRLKEAAKGREIKTSVNTWLLESVISQLKKEGY